MNPPSVSDPLALAAIPARSEQQAMDWSLVLASQGIEVAIDHAGDAGGWQLIVTPAEQSRAQAILRKYRQENRRLQWLQQVPQSSLDFHSGALLWVFALSLIHVLSDRLADAGSFVTRQVRAGEWWRAFTAVWLHADLGHLASNLVTGVIVLGLAMARYGAGVALLGGLLGGAAGNLAGLWLRDGDYTGLGASGLVMAAVGMLAAQAMALWRLSRHATRLVLPGLLAGTFLFLLFGVNPASDVIAHAGGFVAGVVWGALAVLTRAERFNRAAGILFALLAVGTWIAAAR